ncbi:hypothetical protein SKAU_G00348140 [Synaphobranchus kaupii]|uniref:Uncharacterized protein n=1 Tax=Synaphobranchus kaupii TaxID=118154 RepID=A0A9Q1EJV9_SYNKA|nr:hypothetical protein SKAU_G00348140 [Synaphobranchus kaupii]
MRGLRGHYLSTSRRSAGRTLTGLGRGGLVNSGSREALDRGPRAREVAGVRVRLSALHYRAEMREKADVANRETERLRRRRGKGVIRENAARQGDLGEVVK